MKVAIVGSRGLTVDRLEEYLPESVTEIISGGAVGIDRCARAYAVKTGIPFTEFPPEYGKGAPLRRNLQIIERADWVIAFWDGASHGTKFVIDACKKRGKEVTVYLLTAGSNR